MLCYTLFYYTIYYTIVDYTRKGCWGTRACRSSSSPWGCTSKPLKRQQNSPGRGMLRGQRRGVQERHRLQSQSQLFLATLPQVLNARNPRNRFPQICLTGCRVLNHVEGPIGWTGLSASSAFLPSCLGRLVRKSPALSCPASSAVHLLEHSATSNPRRLHKAR